MCVEGRFEGGEGGEVGLGGMEVCGEHKPIVSKGGGAFHGQGYCHSIHTPAAHPHHIQYLEILYNTIYILGNNTLHLPM